MSSSTPPPPPVDPPHVSVAAVAGGVLGQLVKQYKKLSNWDLGWGVLETRQITGENGKAEAKIKTRVVAIPLDGFVKYFGDCELVAARLEKAAEQLVQRWNQQEPKKVLEWKDSIEEQEWVGRGGKKENSVYELILSTYAFFVSSTGDSRAVITPADLKVWRRLELARGVASLTLLLLLLATRRSTSS